MPNVLAALPNIGGAFVQLCKVWLMPNTTAPCSNAAKTRNPLKLTTVTKIGQQISAVSGPKFTILWRHVKEIALFNKLFPIVNMCLSCEYMSRQNCVKVCRWRIFYDFFCILHFQQAACSMFQTCILNSHKGHTMCRSMVDIQSATAEIRRGKKETRQN